MKGKTIQYNTCYFFVMVALLLLQNCILYRPTPATEELACINAKERDKKEREKNKGKESRHTGWIPPPNTSREIDEFVADEERDGKQKKQGVGPQLSYPGPFGLVLRPAWTIR